MNHLRNCTTTADGLEFRVGYLSGDYDLELDDSVRPWISKLLSDVLRREINLCFTKLRLRLGLVNAAHAVDLMSLTSDTFGSSTEDNGMRTVSLQVNYEALERLAEKHFLQWPYLQRAEDIRLRIVRLRLPPNPLSDRP